jgi:hypothetical protein
MFQGKLFAGISTTATRERLRTICYLLFAICYCIRASGEKAPELGRLRENNKVPERADYSRRDQAAIDLNF